MSKPTKRTLTCVTPHGTFTKTTSRTYTHVVVGFRVKHVGLETRVLWVGRPELVEARVKELTTRDKCEHLGTYEVSKP